MEPMERTLPYNLEAERAVLGAILVHNEAFEAACETITAEDFFREAHQRMFRAMVSLHDQREVIDFVTLKNVLGRIGDLDEVGGPAYIASLADGVPRATNVENYAKIVKEKSTLRALIYAANKVLTSAYDSELDAATILDFAESEILAIGEQKDKRQFAEMHTVVSRNYERLEQVFDRKGLISGIATGFTDLDEMTRGLQSANLILIGARPSMGKTSLVLNIAQHVAQPHREQHVGFFSLEMSESELFMRMLSSEAQIDSHRIQSGALGQKDFGRLTAAMESLRNLHLHIDDTANISLREMRSKARRLKNEHGLHMLIVDYIQLMESAANERYENRTVELGKISRGLKGLSKELDVPVVVLTQLSRGPESRSDHRPQLSDLRESGALEQDADVVILVYRDDAYNRDPNNPDAGIAELNVAKARNGPTGVVKLAFLREQTRFANLAPSGF